MQYQQIEESKKVRIFPRRKAFQDARPHKGKALMVDISTLQPLFGLPQEEASKLLGISVTAMKQLCRKLGVGRWPYQKPTHKERASPISQDFDAQISVSVVDEPSMLLCSLPEPIENVSFHSFEEQERRPELSSLPSWDSEATTDTSSDFDLDFSDTSEIENELESLLEPEFSMIDPFRPLL
ncbi:hypothetical protein GUITHDRAFT_100822 [Guillardia theta CCMP2712]|uniref:RWP-RK domain-containing protein n=1 Tax=Guillardia theta (strain CCMP2712) TaxID=905079 RepID=L1JZ66_GUITC|nr:hypothetical protein GUITHDRAFT_100822 [Guillardia theta CCMP2712]EKX53856.1 hypothetical protein GUITHDRAFT_100822 [Guillardia theta CCMP2712]|eukprot:XP_005840836.1 hypothetical protein GUITHDRAFT_100822 [Guillardia theta CCMP2712]